MLFALLLLLNRPLDAQLGEYWDNTGATTVLRTGSGAPMEREGFASAWTGTHLFIWGGHPFTGTTPDLSSGGLYNSLSDAWEAKSNLNQGIGAPAPRRRAVAVWTGTVFVVYGGMTVSPINDFNNGGAYDPATDTWQVLPNLNIGTGAPGDRLEAMAAWTGDRMVVFGGMTRYPPGFDWGSALNGGVYNPVLDVWDTQPNLNAPIVWPWFNNGRGVWTGKELLCRGGDGVTESATLMGQRIFGAGGVYVPSTDTWRSTPNLRVATLQPRTLQAVGWTGEWYLEFGGLSTGPTPTGKHNNGLKYDPHLDLLLSSPTLNSGVGAPSVRDKPIYAWTGAQFVVWAGSPPVIPGPGQNTQPYPNDGGIYSPLTDAWLSAPNLNNGIGSPTPVSGQVHTWIGDRLLIWGGQHHWGTGTSYLNTGGVYIPPRVAPTIRNLDPGEPGSSSTTPLLAIVNQPFKHRIVCYGCPEAALMGTDLPPWLQIGFGGPGPLIAKDTNTPFYPWFSAEGGTCDGQWLRGTPGPGHLGLHSFTVFAVNGMNPSTPTKTVWIRVEGPPQFAEAFLSGLNSRYHQVARVGEAFSYQIQLTSLPLETSITTLSLPAWLTLNGRTLSGTPGPNDTGVAYFSVYATNIHGVDGQAYSISVLNQQPISVLAADVNGDSVVNVLDIQIVVNTILAAPVVGGPYVTDVNGDSQSNVNDVQALVNWVLQR